jgi:hypothetical protein
VQVRTSSLTAPQVWSLGTETCVHIFHAQLYFRKALVTQLVVPIRPNEHDASVEFPPDGVTVTSVPSTPPFPIDYVVISAWRDGKSVAVGATIGTAYLSEAHRRA